MYHHITSSVCPFQSAHARILGTTQQNTTQRNAKKKERKPLYASFSSRGKARGTDLQAPDCLLLTPGYESSRQGSSGAGIGELATCTSPLHSRGSPTKGTKSEDKTYAGVTMMHHATKRGFKDCPKCAPLAHPLKGQRWGTGPKRCPARARRANVPPLLCVRMGAGCMQICAECTYTYLCLVGCAFLH